MGILDTPPAYVTGGAIRYRGTDLLRLKEKQRRTIRGDRIAMIFQDALSALNPVYAIGFQLGELFRVHRGMSRADAKRRAIELLDQVRIPAARDRIGDYPHQLSGGMRQRVMIAMALALDPEVVIADEPTTALDVTVQAQIMSLLADLRRDRDVGLILITHGTPVHEGVAGVDSAARPQGAAAQRIPGAPPALTDIPGGCAFHPRCAYAKVVCRHDQPPPVDVGRGHTARCHFAREVLNA
jgi:oligopeptide transport system ATP-binding protein